MSNEEIEEIIIDDDEQQQLYEHYRIVADKGQVPLRIDKFLFEHMQHSSRNRIQKAADAGFVHVNERPVKSNYKVRPGDVITLIIGNGATDEYDFYDDTEDIPEGENGDIGEEDDFEPVDMNDIFDEP